MCDHKIFTARFTDDARIRFVITHVGADRFPHLVEHTRRSGEMNAGKLPVTKAHVTERGAIYIN